MILSAIQHRTFVVGDPATGTIGDANWVAFHLCVVVLYETLKLVASVRTKLSFLGNNVRTLLEILYFFVILIIPESTANLGFLLIVLAFIFMNEFILDHVRLQGIIIFVLSSVVGFYFVVDTIVYERIESAIYDLIEDNVDENPYLFKASIYKKIATGDIFDDVNPLIGSGPATFTSRSSVVRMPEERVNDFPVELPYFKNKVFGQIISPVYAQWRASKESHGNFASPQTTVISITVELGLFGLFIFGFFFYIIILTLKRKNAAPEHVHLVKFCQYFTLFFIMSLFHLNFWEYPIISFTYIIFVFSIIKQNIYNSSL